MVIVHGSGNPGMSEQDIQIVRASGQKQGKKGRVYGGFYGTSEQDAHQAQAYADMMGGTPTLYDVKIKPGTKVLHKQGDITRLSESYINELVSQGYGVGHRHRPARPDRACSYRQKSAVASMARAALNLTTSQVDETNVADMRQPSDLPANRVSAETVTSPSATAGEASQLAPAIDTGYREVIPVNNPRQRWAMSQLPQYLQSAVKDNAISLAQANRLQQALDQPLPDSPTELNPEIRQTTLLHLYLMDSSKMTQH